MLGGTWPGTGDNKRGSCMLSGCGAIGRQIDGKAQCGWRPHEARALGCCASWLGVCCWGAALRPQLGVGAIEPLR